MEGLWVMLVASWMLLASTCYSAPITINTAGTIPPSAFPGTILALTPNGGSSLCTYGLIVLTDSATECLAFTKADGNVLFTTCETSLVGATNIACGTHFCYVSNPVSGEIVAISGFDGFVSGNFGQGTIQQPSAIAVFEDNTDGYAYVFVVDAATNGLWYFKVNYNNFFSGPEESQLLFTSTATTSPAGISYKVSPSFTDRGTVYLAFVGDTKVQSFYFTASQFGTVPLEFFAISNSTANFTSVERIHVDHYDRLFVHDSGCQCTEVYTLGGTNTNSELVSSFAGDVPTFITTTRNNAILVTNSDITIYEEEIKLYATISNKECDSRLGSISITHSGGALPFSYILSPDNALQVGFESWAINTTVTYTDIDVVPPLYNLPLFTDEGIPARFSLYPEQVVVDSSEIAPYSGNYSFSVLLDPLEGFTLECDACINGRFTFMDFYVNFAGANHTFTISFVAHDYFGAEVLLKTYTILSDDYAPNNWTKISLPMNFDASARFVRFANIADDPFNVTTFYIDEWFFIAGDYSPLRKVVFTDFCGTKVTSNDFLITNDNALSVKLQTSEATCHPDLRGTNSILSSDGTVTAVTINGQAPFTYMWDLPNTNSTSTLTGLEAQTTFIVIYDDAINPDWFDASILPSRNFSDSTMVHSPPYAISLLQPKDGDSLYLKLTSRSFIDATPNSVLTFWVNGGDVGGQQMNLLIKMFAVDMQVSPVVDLIPGISSILPNTWMKATLRFSSSFTFNSILIFEYCPKSGFGCPNTAYFDDFILSISPALIVTDATGCRSKVMDFTITAPPSLTVSTIPTNAKCYNTSNGVVALDVAGGVAPYVVEYSAGNIPKTRSTLVISEISSLVESLVSINVTDAKGCVATRVVETILQPPPLSLKLSLEPVKCYGGSTTLTSTMSGGMAPYTYTWSATSAITQVPQPAPTPVFTDELSAMYRISANVRTECLGTGSQLGLKYPPTHAGYCSLFPTFSQSSPSMTITCPSIAASEFSGIGMWIFVEKSADATNLLISLAKDGVAASTPVALTSIATITPGSWNRVFYNISNTTLTNPNPTQVVVTSSAPTSMGVVILDDIVLMPIIATSVGIVVYPSFNSIVSGAAGQYFLTVVDGNGCSFLKQVNVEEPKQISINVSITGATSANASDGSITAFAAGGTPPYTYFWRTLNTAGQEVHGLSLGGYEVQITDVNGCIYSETFVVPVEEVKTVRAYAKGLSIGLGVFVGIAAIVSLFSLAMLAIYWGSYRKYGIIYSLLLNVGVLLSYVAVLTLLPRPTDALCTAFPWLLGIAFCLVYSCLFVKIWSVYQTYTKPEDSTSVRKAYLLGTLAVALIVEIIVLAVWTATDAPQVKRVEVVNDELQDQCRTDHPTFWIIFIALKGVWLFVGTVLSIISRKTLAERDSNDVAYATYNFLLLLIIGIPLGATLGKVPSARLVVCLIFPVIAFTSTLFIMFFKTWHSTFFHDQIKFPPTNTGSSSHSNSPKTSRSTFTATQSQSHSASASASAY